MSAPDPVREHDRSSRHREAVTAAECVGCFYCGPIYAPAEITDWIDEDDAGIGSTALCARCGIDSVLPVRPGVDAEFLAEMHRHWFS